MKTILLRTSMFVRLCLLLTLLVTITACGSTETDPASDESMGEVDKDSDMNHDDDNHEDHHDDDSHSHDDHSHDDEGHGGARIPNPDGVSVRIVSPRDGATFKAGDDIVVEVEVNNFEIGVDGNHWHVYLNGSSWGMVMGQNYDEVIRAIEPGTHEVSAFLAGGDHIEFEEGSKIMITVEE